jgi:hypothetical protein
MGLFILKLTIQPDQSFENLGFEGAIEELVLTK